MKKVKTTREDILKRLEPLATKLVRNTILRYEKGAMASIFNPSEVKSWAEDMALVVADRVLLWEKNQKSHGAVDPATCEAYFRRSFINHSISVYEQNAKTDKRAGVQTVSSHEAVLLASSRCLDFPEDKMIINNAIKTILDQMKELDEKYNDKVRKKATEEGRTPELRDYVFSHIILSKISEGWEAWEIREFVGLNEADYGWQRTKALDLAKHLIDADIFDLMEHFEDKTDPIMFSREVVKNKKSSKSVYAHKSNFYVQSIPLKKNKWESCLVARIDLTVDGAIQSSKTITVFKMKHLDSEREEVSKMLWEKSKDIESQNMVNEVIQEVMVKRKLAKVA